MLNKQELEKYADILIWAMETSRNERGHFSKGNIVRLFFSRISYPLAEVVYRKCIQKGFHVITETMLSPTMEKNFYEFANDDQLDFLPPWTESKTESLNGNIIIYGSENLTNLKDIDPIKIARKQKPMKKVRDIMDIRENIGKFSWTLCVWPSEDMASHAGLPFEKMFEQVKKACFLDMEDPVNKWKELYEHGKKITSWLKSLEIDSLNLKAETCDLNITLGENRKFISLSGHNIPSFEVFTSPDKFGTDGYFYSDQPSFRNGNYVKGVYLRFKLGKVVEARASQGENFLKSQLETDEGAKYLGEFSLTDKRHSRINAFLSNTLYDENFGGKHGNSHIAIGASYQNTFDGRNKWSEAKALFNFNESALHWDLVNTKKKRVTAKLKNGSKVIIYDDGMFTM